MRIKKLELVGFKSFKDRTVIHFDAGITGIVGPNGCGKSNIVDALVWVMGEMSAKHLRGSSMEDVIFAGAEGYAPMGLAEVSLTLENDGGPFPVQYLKHSEIMVTRRLHRNGESEYLVNREPARLRDIQEVFMDTGAGSKGFSIVEQGAIGKIITSKPEDRRTLIEEAAGITKFKARKRESQRKLISTEQNLVRLQDIVGELKRQIDSLQRQAQRAERYRGLKREMEDLDLWLSSRSYIELKSMAENAEIVFKENEVALSSSAAEVSRLESEMEGRRAAVSLQETQVSDEQNRHFEVRQEIARRESEVQELRFEIEQARRNKEMTGSLVQENQTRADILRSDVERVEAQLIEVRETAMNLKSQYQVKSEKFAEIERRIQEVDDQLTTARRELLTVSQGESHISARVISQQETLQSVQERETELKAVLFELQSKREEFDARRKKVYNNLERERQMQLDLAKDVESLEANRTQLSGHLEQRRLEVEQFKDELNQVASRLYGLENLQANLEGFESGVKSVLFWQREKLKELPEAEQEARAQFRPVAEVVEVQAEYELAMEAALGPRLQMLLAESSMAAVDAVQYLKGQNAGRSSFMPGDFSGAAETVMEMVTDSEGRQMQVAKSRPVQVSLAARQQSDTQMRAQPGVKALLLDVVKAPERFHSSVTRLLDGIAVVDSLQTALRILPEAQGWSFVTAEGDVLGADGSLTGGTSDSADSGMLKRRREIKELSLRKDECAGKLALAQVSLRKIDENLKAAVDDLENAHKRNTEKEIALAELKKDMERAETELQNADNAIQRQDRDVAAVQTQILSRQKELLELEARRDELRERKQGLEQGIEALTQEWQASRAGVSGLQEEVTRLEVQAATKGQERDSLERELAILQKSLGEVETLLARMSEESSKSSETMTSGQVLLEERKIQLESMIRQSEEMHARIGQLRNDYERLANSLREDEKVLSGHMLGRNTLQAKMNEAQLHLEQAQMKEQYLLAQVRERYLIELPDVVEKYRDRDGDPIQAETQVRELREKLSKIGDVNLAAIEEYDEVAKRHEFLSKQYNDLQDAKENLKKVIDRINRICSKRFKETFDMVNERFTKVFPVLFGGGEAQLILVEDPEKGEMGIDIVAKPPGKKMQNVTLLSGGEKALTAVSLIFSIFLVKPSPYCLLDEVDAPLDDANVFRFNDLVREMAKRSQIIVVTHNKYTMEVASKLYGVTMQEKGVSKMVSVNLGDAQAAVAEA